MLAVLRPLCPALATTSFPGCAPKLSRPIATTTRTATLTRAAFSVHPPSAATNTTQPARTYAADTTQSTFGTRACWSLAKITTVATTSLCAIPFPP
mgnify:CR=1 FL=1